MCGSYSTVYSTYKKDCLSVWVGRRTGAAGESRFLAFADDLAALVVFGAGKVKGVGQECPTHAGIVTSVTRRPAQKACGVKSPAILADGRDEARCPPPAQHHNPRVQRERLQRRRRRPFLPRRC